MPVWTEVQAGDMQREQENAYMFRRCAMKEDWAMLATQIGNPGPETPDFKFECYARDSNAVEHYTMSITRAEFDALTRDQVGVDTEDSGGGGEEAPTEAPVNIDVPHVEQFTGSVNCTMGNWSNTPTSYSYVWMLDGNPSPTGDDSPDYYPQPGDVGKLLHCVVTATNDIGSTAAPPSNEITIAPE